MKPLLTVDETSELTRLSTKTPYPFAKKKKVPHVGLGGRVFFEEFDFQERVDRNRELVPLLTTDSGPVEGLLRTLEPHKRLSCV